MHTETAKLTIRLPQESLDFAKSYAKAHGVSVTEIIDRYLRSLRDREHRPSAEVERITGLIPTDIKGEADPNTLHYSERHGLMLIENFKASRTNR